MITIRLTKGDHEITKNVNPSEEFLQLFQTNGGEKPDPDFRQNYIVDICRQERSSGYVISGYTWITKNGISITSGWRFKQKAKA